MRERKRTIFKMSISLRVCQLVIRVNLKKSLKGFTGYFIYHINQFGLLLFFKLLPLFEKRGGSSGRQPWFRCQSGGEFWIG